MREARTITPDKVEQVKSFIKSYSLRGAASKARVSYYTAWNISKGKYDSTDPLKTKKETKFFQW